MRARVNTHVKVERYLRKAGGHLSLEFIIIHML